MQLKNPDDFFSEIETIDKSGLENYSVRSDTTIDGIEAIYLKIRKYTDLFGEKIDTDDNYIFLNSQREDDKSSIGDHDFSGIFWASSLVQLSVNTILGYDVSYPQEDVQLDMKEYQHRAFFVSPNIRDLEAAKFLHQTLNQITGIPQKEINKVPSLILFYLRNGYDINKIHLSNTRFGYNPSRNISLREEGKIIELIKWCFLNGDIKLPFHIELKYSGKDRNILMTHQTLDTRLEGYFGGEGNRPPRIGFYLSIFKSKFGKNIYQDPSYEAMMQDILSYLGIPLRTFDINREVREFVAIPIKAIEIK